MKLNLRERAFERLLSGPTGRQILADLEAEQASARKRLQAAILKRREDFEKEHRPLREALDAAKVSYQEAVKVLEQRQR